MRTEIKNLKERDESIERNIIELYGRKLEWEIYMGNVGWAIKERYKESLPWLNEKGDPERNFLVIETSRGVFLMNGYGEITTWDEQNNLFKTGDKRFSTMKEKMREERLKKLLG